MRDIANELVSRFDIRLSKTKLQQSTIEAFGQIHNITVEKIEEMLALLQNFISNLPSHQLELFDTNFCYPGFISWNSFWKESYAEALLGISPRGVNQILY